MGLGFIIRFQHDFLEAMFFFDLQVPQILGECIWEDQAKSHPPSQIVVAMEQPAAVSPAIEEEAALKDEKNEQHEEEKQKNSAEKDKKNKKRKKEKKKEKKKKDKEKKDRRQTEKVKKSKSTKQEKKSQSRSKEDEEEEDVNIASIEDAEAALAFKKANAPNEEEDGQRSGQNDETVRMPSDVEEAEEEKLTGIIELPILRGSKFDANVW